MAQLTSSLPAIDGEDADAAPAVTLIAPGGGETLQVGQPVTVSWKVESRSRLVGQRVELSIDGGASFRDVSPELGETVRSYIFMPNAAMATACARIRIAAVDADARRSTDQSGRDFAIALAGPTRPMRAVRSSSPGRRPGLALPAALPRTEAAVALLARPGSATAVPGRAVSTEIGIARTNFVGLVELRATGLPAGARAWFFPEATTGTSVVLNIETSSDTPEGSAHVTVSGRAPGVTIAPIAIELRVERPALDDLPAITGFFPHRAAPGSRVAVRGTNLGGSMLVQFGGAPAVFVVMSPTLILATVPDDAQSGRIRLVADGTSAVSACTFSVLGGGHAPRPKR